MLHERMRLVRDTLKLTQRGMASSLGITQSTWHTYEAGQCIPGGDVLLALLEKGININWVLSGRGSIFVGGNGGDDASELEANAEENERLQELQSLVDEFGLDAVAAVASTGEIADEFDVLIVLGAEYPMSLSVAEICRQLRRRGRVLDEGRVRQALSLLVLRKLAFVSPDQSDRYVTSNSAQTLVARDIRGHVQQVKLAVKFFCQRLLPRLSEGPECTRIHHARVPIDEAQASGLLGRIVDAHARAFKREASPTGDTELELVLGAVLRKRIDLD